MEEAIAMSSDCLAGYLYDCQKYNESVPAPSDIISINPDEYLKELYDDAPLPEYFMNIVSVDVAAYAKEHFEKSVKKTLLG